MKKLCLPSSVGSQRVEQCEGCRIKICAILDRTPNKPNPCENVQVTEELTEPPLGLQPIAMASNLLAMAVLSCRLSILSEGSGRRPVRWCEKASKLGSYPARSDVEGLGFVMETSPRSQTRNGSCSYLFVVMPLLLVAMPLFLVASCY